MQKSRGGARETKVGRGRLIQRAERAVTEKIHTLAQEAVDFLRNEASTSSA
jgi:hypothetical protein